MKLLQPKEIKNKTIVLCFKETFKRMFTLTTPVMAYSFKVRCNLTKKMKTIVFLILNEAQAGVNAIYSGA